MHPARRILRSFSIPCLLVTLAACDSSEDAPGKTGANGADDVRTTAVPKEPGQFASLRKEGDWAEAPGMETTTSGLKFVRIQDGEGETPPLGSRVVLHYSGWLIREGKIGRRVMDSRAGDNPVPEEFLLSTSEPSYSGPGTVPFSLSGSNRSVRPVFLKGWVEAIQDMRPGERRLLVVPSALAWGSMGFEGGVSFPKIPENADLAFDLELVGFKAPR